MSFSIAAVIVAGLLFIGFVGYVVWSDAAEKGRESKLTREVALRRLLSSDLHASTTKKLSDEENLYLAAVRTLYWALEDQGKGFIKPTSPSTEWSNLQILSFDKTIEGYAQLQNPGSEILLNQPYRIAEHRWPRLPHWPAKARVQ